MGLGGAGPNAPTQQLARDDGDVMWTAGEMLRRLVDEEDQPAMARCWLARGVTGTNLSGVKFFLTGGAPIFFRVVSAPDRPVSHRRLFLPGTK